MERPKVVLRLVGRSRLESAFSGPGLVAGARSNLLYSPISACYLIAIGRDLRTLTWRGSLMAKQPFKKLKPQPALPSPGLSPLCPEPPLSKKPRGEGKPVRQ